MRPNLRGDVVAPDVLEVEEPCQREHKLGERDYRREDLK
jgi:hypothetical protein